MSVQQASVVAVAEALTAEEGKKVDQESTIAVTALNEQANTSTKEPSTTPSDVALEPKLEAVATEGARDTKQDSSISVPPLEESVKRKAQDLVAEGAKKVKKEVKQNSITSFFKAPKASISSSTAGAKAGPHFNKSSWVKSLSPDAKELLKLEIDTIDESWLAALKEELVTPEFLELKRFLKSEFESGQTIYPPKQDIYSWSRLTPLPKVKVVILGQDPYHGPNQAHGLCFSVRPPTPAPPSLKNIYIALAKDYPTFVPPPKKGGLLTPWAERGVLMLNTCLTVRKSMANSHANKGWERFTGKVIETVNRVRQGGVVFMAWGTPAQKRCDKITSRHLVLRSVHPSPLSASRGWFDCGHFKKANEWLKERYGEDGEIDWSLAVVPAKLEV